MDVSKKPVPQLRYTVELYTDYLARWFCEVHLTDESGDHTVWTRTADTYADALKLAATEIQSRR